MRVEQQWVARQQGAMGEELMATGETRAEAVNHLLDLLKDSHVNAFAHEQQMTALSMENNPQEDYPHE